MLERGDGSSFDHGRLVFNRSLILRPGRFPGSPRLGWPSFGVVPSTRLSGPRSRSWSRDWERCSQLVIQRKCTRGASPDESPDIPVMDGGGPGSDHPVVRFLTHLGWPPRDSPEHQGAEWRKSDAQSGGGIENTPLGIQAYSLELQIEGYGE